MNWVTTNIRLPEELYMELKFEAARRRTSFAHVAREKLAPKLLAKPQETQRVLTQMKKLGKENQKYLKGKNLSDLLIEMRYEQ